MLDMTDMYMVGKAQLHFLLLSFFIYTPQTVNVKTFEHIIKIYFTL